MSSRFQRGVTLVELLIASSILLLIATVAITLTRVGQVTQQETQGVATLTADMLLAAKQLRKDIKATALNSIAVTATPPSCSMATVGEQNQTTQFAAPNWKNHIHYTLQAENNGSAQLLRWTGAKDSPSVFPKVSPWKSWEIPSDAKKSVVLKSVLAPGWSVRSQSDDYRLAPEGGAAGGFQARFVRWEADGSTSLSTVNPSTLTDRESADWSRGNSPLLSVNLTILKAGSKPVSSLEFEVKACPRN